MLKFNEGNWYFYTGYIYSNDDKNICDIVHDVMCCSSKNDAITEIYSFYGKRFKLKSIMSYSEVEEKENKNKGYKGKIIELGA